MGTYYGLGIIAKFNAKSQNILSDDDWKRLLNDRIDTELFDFVVDKHTVSASLKEGIFKDNIEDFYKILKTISNDKGIDYYYSEFGSDIENYQKVGIAIKVLDNEGNSIKISISMALLFIEGKVSVERFNIDPKLINWLFRHSDISNKLSGCVISDIV